ncbi:4-hydroxy-3-methylbut-2-en-1-yl diphosphate synthase [Prevotella sp. kh1p2]|uniref:4-hydroxy-3-methylbut-2-en-1-yl diphosphate synthase n=1 Tax=Prevotella sp. kh1p2 TaxID=1761883 RepID=UPI0008BC8122|nr:4-hydroxy-3-methylbut-2-en-1-yl diphosphate synthase [Prevotella sp. kh1p2]SES70675.1 4-hydroxy-3-methylbut-2-en-1-yl diphosphate synthase [Prevotella sp. kh1p2]SNU10379.1 4-hydroxy-3-methylbut-2-en-1-yl diphosphate synthase [Prevotellaceae bacterium KH2P17]
MTDIFNYSRRPSGVVHVGAIDIGGDNPVRIQSMTTTSTDDTEGSVAQAERIIKAGGELVRLTTQGTKEAENLKNINAGIRSHGFNTPLVADVHFNPNVADVAARYAEKVRINPGNYVDPARKFIKREYTDEEYADELRKIEERFVPFLNICKANHTAIRIGVNHGSLSDRIRNRYGDTPEGIVESCMEFLRICKKQDFSDVVISIKSSNTVVMVRSVRLLVTTMEHEDMHYPLHLGVTEAGEGEDGRIKSAVGIGALLADGIGDTIRVSLSEEPEEEIPVARRLVEYIGRKAGHLLIPAEAYGGFDWVHPERRLTQAVGNIGGENVPVVIGNLSPIPSPKARGVPVKADYVYLGSDVPEEFEEGQRYIVDFNVYADLIRSPKAQEEHLAERLFPIFPVTAMPFMAQVHSPLKFLVLQFGTPADEYIACLRQHPETVVVCTSNHRNRLGDQRALVHEMMIAGLQNPVVMAQMYRLNDKEQFQLESAADMGALMIDGLTDGIWLMNDGNLGADVIEDTSFGILQAARLRTSKTEYISCPGCGRTLYDLRETIARIKAATADMKGLKIGIMGCIVNGPGEMADADYGYVGAGVNRVSLYRKQVCVEKNIPQEVAVEHLLALIRKDREAAG